MSNAIYRDLGQGISCIDANYGRPGVACFYLLEHNGVCAIIETGTARSLENLQYCLAQKSISAAQVRYIIPTQFRPQAFLESVQLLKSYCPKRMFPTHFGELSYSDKAADMLCEQVRAYPEIAREFAGDPEGLRRRIMDFTLSCLAPFDPPGGLAAFSSVIEADVALNAQGLLVWLSRLQKNRDIG